MPTPASAYKPAERIFAAFLSRSGDGKSTAAASFAEPCVEKGKKLLDLDFDFRFDGIKAAIAQGLISEEGIEYEQIPRTKGGFATLNKFMDSTIQQRIAGSIPWGCIITDSITSLTRLFVVESHEITKGKKIGLLRMSGPSDFGFEVSAMAQYFDFLQSLKCHIIVSGHLIDRWGKPKPLNATREEIERVQYAPNEIIGEKLAVRDNVSENFLLYFGNVFKFSREQVGHGMKYLVEFSTDVAKNTFGIPPGRFDITGKKFYPFLQELIAKVKNKEDISKLYFNRGGGGGSLLG